MVTEFEVIDVRGKVVATGEIDGDTYRVFSNKDPSECQEFESLESMLSACGGTGIQPSLFETPPRDRQLNLLGETPPHERHTTPHECRDPKSQ